MNRALSHHFFPCLNQVAFVDGLTFLFPFVEIAFASRFRALLVVLRGDGLLGAKAELTSRT